MDHGHMLTNGRQEDPLHRRRSLVLSLPGASLVVSVALTGCAGAAPDPTADTTTSATTNTTVAATAPSTTEPTTTTTVVDRASTTTTSEPEVLTTAGIVIDVDGDLTGTTAVTILDGDGVQIVFVPSPDATFHGGPVSHIRDHLLSGLPVVVEYRLLGDGTFEAISFADADHDN